MNEQFLRLPKVMEATGLAKSTVWLWVKQNKLPTPIKLSARVTVWKLSDIEAWQEEQAQGGVAC
ncbi:helix-turn-helix transcriptional regulator [Sulfurimonas sp. NW9]|uniref:helix-turn-helix transcriptional regulator n=1 Tax=Sulfurimonas sp. NW9 TaxID=2922728 RepID=UPI003DA81DD3